MYLSSGDYFMWSLILFLGASLILLNAFIQRRALRPEDLTNTENIISMILLVLFGVLFHAGIITLFFKLNFIQAILGGSACVFFLELTSMFKK